MSYGLGQQTPPEGPPAGSGTGPTIIPTEAGLSPEMRAAAEEARRPSRMIQGYLMDSGTWIFAGAGAALGYGASRDATAAAGGAMVGASMILMAHHPTAYRMSLPFMVTAAVMGSAGIWMMSRPKKVRSNRRRRRRRTSRRRR